MKLLWTSKDGCPILRPLDREAHDWLLEVSEEYACKCDTFAYDFRNIFPEVEITQGAVGELLVEFFACDPDAELVTRRKT